jgi:pimeloyl-ACP methyl ester carboxylesterase
VRIYWPSFLLFVIFLAPTLARPQQHDSDQPPNVPGQMVDIGGYRMHLYCIGHGSPSVILLNGAGDIFADWALVQPDIAQFTRVCTFDYAWEGFSDAGPVPITMHQEVFETHLMLENARISPPYLLVGHSSGGMLAQLFTMTYPTDVAGLVLVDSLHEDTVMGNSMFRSRATGKTVPPPQTMKTSPAPTPTPEEQRRFEERTKQVQAESPAPIGPPLNRLPPDALQLRAWVHAHPRLLTGAQSDPMLWMPEELQQVHLWRQEKIHPFGDMPIVVIGVLRDNSVSVEERRRQLDDMESLSTNGKVVIDSNSGHHVQWDDPKFVVQTVKEDYEAVIHHSKLAK